jgi:hypothetical protein
MLMTIEILQGLYWLDQLSLEVQRRYITLSHHHVISALQVLKVIARDMTKDCAEYINEIMTLFQKRQMVNGDDDDIEMSIVDFGHDNADSDELDLQVGVENLTISTTVDTCQPQEKHINELVSSPILPSSLNQSPISSPSPSPSPCPINHQTSSPSIEHVISHAHLTMLHNILLQLKQRPVLLYTLKDIKARFYHNGYLSPIILDIIHKWDKRWAMSSTLSTTSPSPSYTVWGDVCIITSQESSIVFYQELQKEIVHKNVFVSMRLLRLAFVIVPQ